MARLAHYGAERLIAAGAAEVWAVVADPAVVASLDDRLTLVASEGEAGTIGSSWEMDFRRGRRTFRLRGVVTDAIAGEDLTYDGYADGRLTASQVGTLVPAGDQTLVLWSVTNFLGQWVPAFLVRRNGRRLTRKWLASIEREVLRRQAE